MIRTGRTASRTIQRPPWMNAKSYPQFLTLREQIARRANAKNLSARELHSLALLRFVQRHHSASFPTRPEFPPWNPKFPATQTRKIKIPGLERVTILLKDESLNPSGTHKSRMGWEVAREYAKMLERKLRTGREIPQMSIISAGNGAMAIGDMLAFFGGPKINALVDKNLSPQIIAQMERHNVIVFRTDLSKKELGSDEILKLTRNSHGIDLTRGKLAEEIARNYYDWLTFEILNAKPEYVIVPYGTGQLFDNILMHYNAQLRELKADPRLLAERMREGGLNLIGVAAPVGSVAEKLSAPFLSDSTKHEFKTTKRNIVTQMISQGILGEHSRIEEVEDKWFFEARKIARELKIRAEPSALAGLAWLLKHKKDIPKSRTLIVNTGRGIFAED